jgi:hypothetical protein
MHRIRSWGYPYEISELTNLRSAKRELSTWMAFFWTRPVFRAGPTTRPGLGVSGHRITDASTRDDWRPTIPWRFLSGSLQAHPFHPGNQGGGLYPQKLRGSISAFDFPVGFLQHSKQILALPMPHF